MMIHLARLLFSSMILIVLSVPVWGQNVTPKPTAFDVSNAVTPKPKPTPLRRANLDLQRITNARVEGVGGSRVVFSEDSRTTWTVNRALYYWEPGAERLLNTQEAAMPGTIQVDEDGRYMVFLYNELTSDGATDIDGDGIRQVILRMYHFDTRQVVNLGAPARSATPLPDETRSQFQIALFENTLTFSSSTATTNSLREVYAPWHIVDMMDLLYLIEGTPTPTPTPMPTPAPTTPTPTPSLSARTDINGDGRVDAQDLLWMQLYWQASSTD